ncbi:MAG: GNAT family N-acetyltransferase [Frankiaceae bacterium]|nr:GNAT family N-acetyltransferase [Frankiaceae bacterium]
MGALRVRIGDLELRLPDADQLAQLAALAADGVHDPAQMPFATPWTDGSAEQRGRSVLLHAWRTLGRWEPAAWNLPLVVLRRGEVVGVQEVQATNFAPLREVITGSWLGLRFHRMGIGTAMRAAVLHLAFAGLGAEYALSGALADNAASLGVSRRLGYQPDGIDRVLRRGEPTVMRRLRLSREQWLATPRPDVRIENLTPCLPLFGLAAPGDAAAAEAAPGTAPAGSPPGGAEPSQ